MLLTRSLCLEYEEHVVAPLDVPKVVDNFLFLSLVRFRASGDFTGKPQWLAWAFPNPDGQFNTWQYTLRSDAQLMDRAFSVVGMCAHHTTTETPALCRIVSTLDQALLGVEWDAQEDLSANFDEIVQFIKATYGKHYAFALVRIDKPGDYFLAWEWWGSYPFVMGTTLKDQLTHPLTALVFNTHRLEWTRPGLYDSGPPQQHTCVDSRVLQSVGKDHTAPLACLVGVAMADRRNSDLVATRMDWGSCTRTRSEHTACLLM